MTAARVVPMPAARNETPAQRERRLAVRQAWAEANAEHLRAEARRWRRENPEAAREHKRRWALKQYGLTPEGYAALLEGQGGGCAICHRAADLVVDHSHVTGVVRGILCRRCNAGLGHFLDSRGLLAAASEYLG